MKKNALTVYVGDNNGTATQIKCGDGIETGQCTFRVLNCLILR